MHHMSLFTLLSRNGISTNNNNNSISPRNVFEITSSIIKLVQKHPTRRSHIRKSTDTYKTYTNIHIYTLNQTNIFLQIHFKALLRAKVLNGAFHSGRVVFTLLVKCMSTSFIHLNETHNSVIYFDIASYQPRDLSDLPPPPTFPHNLLIIYEICVHECRARVIFPDFHPIVRVVQVGASCNVVVIWGYYIGGKNLGSDLPSETRCECRF